MRWCALKNAFNWFIRYGIGFIVTGIVLFMALPYLKLALSSSILIIATYTYSVIFMGIGIMLIIMYLIIYTLCIREKKTEVSLK
ncbi:hypothetical protein [Vulcanisaeta distributa]|uniref:hypothetical protein n=1 Tax=Vulcanisaeta distributa TaxID=164451 RepID=UPI0006D1F8D9|nr:hypothetical protein [Vulcanisaeta distributa]